MITYPHQKTIVCHKEHYSGDFIQIRKDYLYAANRDLSPYGVQLYLYLAGNRDGYQFALSQEAVLVSTGMTKTTYHKYVNLLIEKGYLVPKGEGSSVYDFYETPYGKGLAVYTNKHSSSQTELESSQSKSCDSHSVSICSYSNKEKNNIGSSTDNKYRKTPDGSFSF